MKIVWISHFVPYPPRGGAPQRSWNLIRGIAANHSVHFAGLSLKTQQRTAGEYDEAREALSKICDGVTILREGFHSSPPGKVMLGIRAILKRRSLYESWLIDSRTKRMAAEAIASHRPDLVHVDAGTISQVLPADYRGPAVLTHHDAVSHMMRRRIGLSRGLMRAVVAREASLVGRMERRVAPRFARHLVCSRLDGERLRETAGEIEYTVIPNGVDTGFFRPTDDSEEPSTVIFSGRMNQFANEQSMLKFLRELWPALKDRVPGVRLVIAGMNPTKRLFAAAEGDESITITGFLDDVRPHLTRATVYLCPIIYGGGTRLKILDAMSMEKPIVATPIAAEGLDVTDGRDILLREFGPPFVEGIAQLLSSEELRRKLAEEARLTAVREYDWGAIAAKLEDVYGEVISEYSREY
jgi:glycosyltransferase involved in cell wall biosynthesis